MNTEIVKQGEDDEKWDFKVSVGELNYSVELEKSYWEKLTNKEIEPEELVKKSFEFLLKRETKESILRKFNLKIINKYFPEYEREILN